MSESSLKLAGFALAHAAWSISDGQTLCTLAFTENKATRRLLRFEADSIPDSLDLAREKLQRQQIFLARWALVFDGYLNIAGKRRDALITQLWSKLEEVPARVIQLYRPTDSIRRFKILGQPILVDEGGVMIEDETYQQWLLDGVMDHPQVATLWSKWFQRA